MEFSSIAIIIPPIVLLIPYIIGVILYLIFSFFNMYHLVRFGSKTKSTYFLALFFVIFTLLNFAVTTVLLWGVDWNSNFNLDTSFGI